MWTRDLDPGPSLWTHHELLVTGPSLSGLPISTITSESDPHKRQLVAGTPRASVQSYLTVGLRLPSPACCTPPLMLCFCSLEGPWLGTCLQTRWQLCTRLVPGVPRITQGTRFPSAGTLTWPCLYHCIQGLFKPSHRAPGTVQNTAILITHQALTEKQWTAWWAPACGQSSLGDQSHCREPPPSDWGQVHGFSLPTFTET